MRANAKKSTADTVTETETEIEGTELKLLALQEKAKVMGISFNSDTGITELESKITIFIGLNEIKEEKQKNVVSKVRKADSTEETQIQRRKRLKRESAKLIRVVVVCRNPNKTEWTGQTLSVGNSFVGMYKEFVPFNNENGWHIPNIVYKALLEKECQIFYTVEKNNHKTRKGKQIKEFAVTVLPPLTMIEIEDLKTQQAIANTI